MNRKGRPNSKVKWNQNHKTRLLYNTSEVVLKLINDSSLADRELDFDNVRPHGEFSIEIFPFSLAKELVQRVAIVSRVKPQKIILRMAFDCHS